MCLTPSHTASRRQAVTLHTESPPLPAFLATVLVLYKTFQCMNHINQADGGELPSHMTERFLHCPARTLTELLLVSELEILVNSHRSREGSHLAQVRLTRRAFGNPNQARIYVKIYVQSSILCLVPRAVRHRRDFQMLFNNATLICLQRDLIFDFAGGRTGMVLCILLAPWACLRIAAGSVYSFCKSFDDWALSVRLDSAFRQAISSVIKIDRRMAGSQVLNLIIRRNSCASRTGIRTQIYGKVYMRVRAIGWTDNVK
ncbi:hypothetical protein BDN72DRAFT_877265 [Pluteus cervinus]|uniref:Uncharacterized protein n=1 Tax=Pluteus cervinus TaxID=181527 RepID=A0ACD3AZR6_9AGAR|nr:hypothetical protein BDN72DRAFT_877265 [Pluteus cervinus]